MTNAVPVSSESEILYGPGICVMDLGGSRLEAVVSDRLGPVSYLIQLENRDYWRKHVDLLRTGSDPESKPTENDPSWSPHPEEIPDDT